jgi:uncharacterized protein (DUF433 family)
MPVPTSVRETVAQQNPVDVPLYTPVDVARYLRVPLWLALVLSERGRVPPHPEWFMAHWGWKEWPLSAMFDDGFPFSGPPDDFPRISFRRLADLHVRLFAVQAVVELGRSSPQEARARGLRRTLRLAVEDLAHEPGLFEELPAEEGITRLLGRVTTQPHEVDPAWMEKWLKLRLDRVDLEGGIPVQLYPFTRDPAEHSPRMVVLDPRIRFGRPTVAGRGTPTDMLFERHQAGDSIAELTDDYGLAPGEVEEALRYEALRPLWGFSFFGG